MIVRLSVAWPAGRAGEEEGVVRLLGGGVEAGRAIRAWPGMAMQVVAGREGGAAAGSAGGSSAQAYSEFGYVGVQASGAHYTQTPNEGSGKGG